ncbi:hypothetical protein GE061_014751, partial [Apolygus lucorum]
GIPLALPADTLEVAVGKQAHAIAHATQSAVTTGLAGPLAINPVLAAPAAVAAINPVLAAPAAVAAINPALAASSLVAPGVLAGPLGINGLAGIHGIIG